MALGHQNIRTHFGPVYEQKLQLNGCDIPNQDMCLISSNLIECNFSNLINYDKFNASISLKLDLEF